MNILFTTHLGEIAGATYSIAYLAEGLSQKNNAVWVAAKKNTLLHRLLQDKDVNFIDLEMKGRFDLKALFALRKLVQKHNIQLINAQSSYDRYLSVWLKKLFFPKLLVVHTRRQMVKSIGGFFQNMVYYRGTNSIVAVSNGVKQSIIEKGIPANHITLIYNGLPLWKLKTPDEKLIENLKNKYEIKPGTCVIGCVARRKKQADILKCLPFLKQAVTVILVGLEKREEDEILLKALPPQHKVFFTGTIDSPTALAHYKLFTIKILPSLIEGLSQSLLEAMALKIPIIATDAGGNSDLISHKHNGYLYPDGNTSLLAKYIEELLSSPLLASQMAENAHHNLIQNFTLDKTINSYHEHFTYLLNIN